MHCYFMERLSRLKSRFTSLVDKKSMTRLDDRGPPARAIHQRSVALSGVVAARASLRARLSLALPASSRTGARARSLSPAASSTPPSRFVLGVATGMITRLGTHVGASDEMRLRSGHRVGVTGPATRVPTSAAEARAMLMRDGACDASLASPRAARAPVPPRRPRTPAPRALPRAASRSPRTPPEGPTRLRAPPPPNAPRLRRRPPRSEPGPVAPPPTRARLHPAS